MLRILLVLVLSCGLASADTIREALVNLCDPAKIATITAERGANPRVRKICYWLEMARQAGREPSTEMREVMSAVGWGGTAKGDLTADAMVRNRVLAEELGCLDEAGMSDLRRGNAPTIRCGPYVGDELSVDHIIPRSVCPELDATLANLELMPMQMNRSKSNSIDEEQGALAVKFYDAGFLSGEAMLRIFWARVDSVRDSGPRNGQRSCGNHLIPLVVLEAELRKRGVLKNEN